MKPIHIVSLIFGLLILHLTNIQCVEWGASGCVSGNDAYCSTLNKTWAGDVCCAAVTLIRPKQTDYI